MFNDPIKHWYLAYLFNFFYRFYFITDGHILKFGSAEELKFLLMRFIRMSEKKNHFDVVVLGSGPGGYGAAFRAAGAVRNVPAPYGKATSSIWMW